MAERFKAAVQSCDGTEHGGGNAGPLRPDGVAEASGLIRIVDDSGEDYLYPAENFIPLPLPPAVEKALAGIPAEIASR